MPTALEQLAILRDRFVQTFRQILEGSGQYNESLEKYFDYYLALPMDKVVEMIIANGANAKPDVSIRFITVLFDVKIKEPDKVRLAAIMSEMISIVNNA